MAYIIGSPGQSPERKAASPAKRARTVAVSLPADIALKISVADIARIGPAAGPGHASKARPAKPVSKKKGRRRVAKSKKKSSGRRYACQRCGQALKKKGTYCGPCKKTRRAMVKAATPVCPNPQCRKRGAVDANCCRHCGAPFSQLHAAKAEKSVRAVQLQIAGSPDYWDAQARRQHDPAEREACYAEARKARQARGTENSSLVSMLVKAAGAGTIREAWLREADPQAREVLLRALNQQGGRSA